MFRDYDDNDSIALCDIRPAKNRFRQYFAQRTTSLFGKPALLIVSGRRGAGKVSRLEDFDDEQARERRWDELLTRRARNGYGLDDRPDELSTAAARPASPSKHSSSLARVVLVRHCEPRPYRLTPSPGVAWRVGTYPVGGAGSGRRSLCRDLPAEATSPRSRPPGRRA